MSQFCIYLDLDPYLAQWFIHDSGGSVPVQLERASVESKILEQFLAKRPYNAPPDESQGMVAIYIPTFRHRPAEVYNYLPCRAREALLRCIRNRFDVTLWNELHHFGKIGRRQDELIYAFMEKHGISFDEANWNAIAKRYQRQRNLYLQRQWAENDRNSKKCKKK